MKLLRLKLNDAFRSLQTGFEIHFLHECDYKDVFVFNPYALVGRNGSGKSNILEALAAIFYHIECMYLRTPPEGFKYDDEQNSAGFRAEESFPDAFELEYFFPLELDEYNKRWQQLDDKLTEKPVAHIRIEKKRGQAPEIRWLNRKIFEDTPETRLSGLEVKTFLPSFVIGYSSGENEILSLPFFKMRFIHYDEYKDRLVKALDYGQAPEGRLIYLDNQFSQAILLSNFLLQPPEILQIFEKEIGLQSIREFRIVIRKYLRRKSDTEFALPISELGNEDEDKNKVEFTSKVENFISSLEKCATTHYYDYETDSLYLDYWVNQATKEAFRLHFNRPLTLFQAFQILLTLNLYPVSEKAKKQLYASDSLYVNEIVPTPPSDERVMRFTEFVIQMKGNDERIYMKSLSDGEHQFLHAIGLCLLFKEKPALFLLDEPETHFNPDWRAKLVSTLRECLQAGGAGSVMREVLVTSHSPFIISDCHEENVLVFKKDEETGIVTCSKPNFKTFGASVNQITIKVFDKIETIGDYAKSALQGLEVRLHNGEAGEQLIKEANRILGDSVEKTIFINKVLDTIENKD